MRQCSWIASTITLTIWLPLSIAEPLDGACVGLDNTHECNDAIEAVQLPRWTERASRLDGTLSVVLHSGEQVDFIDGTDRGIGYRFRECNELAEQCVVVAGANEYLRYIVVDLTTGFQSSYRGTPTYSPDGTLASIGGGWGPFGTQFLEIRDMVADEVQFALQYTDVGSLATGVGICESQPNGFVFATLHRPRWISDDRLEFDIHCRDLVATVQVARNSAGWAVVRKR